MSNSTTPPIPHLKSTPHSHQLIVDGRPFLVRGAELQNSSFSSVEYMRDIWPRLAASNINTVLASVAWEDVESVEGTFRFEVLDEQIKAARSVGLRLVLLWFGSFKNGVSTYTPSWVKRDSNRFPRAKIRGEDGTLKVVDVVSVFHYAARDADASAFNRLMAHLKDVDEKHRTVIMVQVENEPGLLGDSRDRSAAAETVFSGSVAQELIEELNEERENLRPELLANLRASLFKSSWPEPGTSWSWSSALGNSPQADEIFMAYQYALYVDFVAAAGKEVYSLPMYTNVWQNMFAPEPIAGSPGASSAGGGQTPGDYPSGGAVAQVLDIWQLFAPSLDFIAPDIYLNSYTETCDIYRHRDQPLFIPEQRRDDFGTRRIWEAFGNYEAIGTAPFGIDTIQWSSSLWKKHYRLLAEVESILLLSQQDESRSSFGFFFDELNEDGSDLSLVKTTKFGQFELTISRAHVFGKAGPGAGMIMYRTATDPDPSSATFLLVGWGYQVSFRSLSPKSEFTGILRFEEKEVTNRETGEMRTLRSLNGDETGGGTVAVMPNEDPDYDGYPIAITIPARTGIAQCEVYSLDEGQPLHRIGE